MGTLRHWLHARHVRFGSSSSGYFRRRIHDLRLFLPSHGTHDRELSQWKRHGLSLCQHAQSDPDSGCGNVRADARARRLYALLLLLSMVFARFQKGIGM